MPGEILFREIDTENLAAEIITTYEAINVKYDMRGGKNFQVMFIV
jgi:hypothetical protein